jgi:hypothetical protein
MKYAFKATAIITTCSILSMFAVANGQTYNASIWVDNQTTDQTVTCTATDKDHVINSPDVIAPPQQAKSATVSFNTFNSCQNNALSGVPDGIAPYAIYTCYLGSSSGPSAKIGFAVNCLSGSVAINNDGTDPAFSNNPTGYVLCTAGAMSQGQGSGYWNPDQAYVQVQEPNTSCNLSNANAW